MHHFDQEAVSAYRTNPLKSNRRTFLMPFLKHLGAIKKKISGKSADHATGLVYSQEPAAQMVAKMAAPAKGKSSLRPGSCSRRKVYSSSKLLRQYRTARQQ